MSIFNSISAINESDMAILDCYNCVKMLGNFFVYESRNGEAYG